MGWRGAFANYGDVSGSALAANRNLNTHGLLDKLSLREWYEDLQQQYSKQNAFKAAGSKGLWLYFRGKGVRLTDTDMV